MKENSSGLLIILGIVAVGLLGGFKNSQNIARQNNNFATNNQNETLTPAQIQRQINDTKRQVEVLQKQVQAENDKKIASEYKDIVQIQSVRKSKNVSDEYIILQVKGKNISPINITGWSFVSTSTGIKVTIPKSTYLFYAGTPNGEQDVYVESGDKIYINTGISPNGYSFKVNKCSGYLEQFQNFNPNLRLDCPRPRDEDLSSIPKISSNDACLDYIERFPQCRIQTSALPLNWNYECTNFIYNKINYPSCVNAHKNDADFYSHEWRIYLKRSAPIWKERRENITLYDNVGKVVDVVYFR